MRKPLVIIIAAALVLAGCSDDEAERTGLLDALGKVAATAQTTVSVEYGEPAKVTALLDRDRNRFQALQGFGYSSIATYGKILGDKLSLDFDGFDGAIFVGEPPKQATMLWGDYDVAAVDGKLSDLDIDSEKKSGGTRWRSADDYEINLENGPFTEAAPPAQLNDIQTGDGKIAFAPAAAGIDWVTEPGLTTLASDDVLAPLATCLGDVVAAQLLATGEAVGVREDATEVICLDEDAAQVSQALKGKVRSTGQPWDELLPGAKVGEDGSLARITVPAQDDRPAGRVMRMMQSGDLAGLR